MYQRVWKTLLMDKNKSVISKFSIVLLPKELRGNKLIEVQENFVLEQKQNADA